MLTGRTGSSIKHAKYGDMYAGNESTRNHAKTESEFQKPRPLWACHMMLYMDLCGRRKEDVSVPRPIWAGKTGGSSKYALYRGGKKRFDRHTFCDPTPAYTIDRDILELPL